MINSFGPLLVSPLASLAWTILWQSTLWLTLGLVVSRLWRGHAARAHLLLVLATVAAVASPLLTIGVRGLGWGFLPAPRVTESAELRLEPTPPIAAPQPPVVEQAEIAVVESMSEQMEPGANSPFERTSLPPAVSSDSTPEAVPPTEATAAWTIRVVSLLPAGFIAAWLLSSLGMAIRVTTSMLAGRRLVRRSVREEHPGLLAALGEARQLLGVFGDVSLRASSVARCPMIWCWGRRPVLLVPPSAGDQSGISWCSIFCHELAHWLRRDHLSALWTELLVIALPWQPLAWLSRRHLSALREQACDDWVLASMREATDYAESLVNLVPQNSPTFALPALRSYESLKRRLEHVLAGVRVTPRAGRNWIALVSPGFSRGRCGNRLRPTTNEYDKYEGGRVAALRRTPRKTDAATAHWFRHGRKMVTPSPFADASSNQTGSRPLAREFDRPLLLPAHARCAEAGGRHQGGRRRERPLHVDV